MTPPEVKSRRVSTPRRYSNVATCPNCQTRLSENPARCPNCRFTGSDTVKMFPGTPPPLVPIADFANLWSPADLKKIAAAQEKTQRRFPQFHWKIYSVSLPRETNLNLFGFWMVNASPLSPDETETQRAWTILLIFNAADGKVTVTPGYAAESWLAHDEWQHALLHMKRFWLANKRGDAVVAFFTLTRDLLTKARRRHSSSKR
jgi:hypothetical protein